MAIELITGRVYTVDESSNNSIFRWNGRDSSEYLGYSQSSKKLEQPDKFEKRAGNFNTPGNYRPATREEILWLETCSKADEYIPRQKLKPEITNEYSIY